MILPTKSVVISHVCPSLVKTINGEYAYHCVADIPL